MKYDHIVVAYGKYYAAGEEVPDNAPPDESEEMPFPDTEMVSETAPAKRGRPKKVTE